MKAIHRYNLQHRRPLSLNLKRRQFPGVVSGFTLVELLVAGVISMVVILVAWSGLVSAMNMSQVNQSRVARQTELNRALDFMTNEIRMARSVNQSTISPSTPSTSPSSTPSLPSTPTTTPMATAMAPVPSTGLASTFTASAVNLSNVVTSTGLNLSALGNYGTLALYLERPIGVVPAICPAGGPNAGSPPPVPASYDPIVYDVRPSPSGWLPPMILARYGRVPQADGSINPCSNPVSSDPIIDALSQTMSQTPTCSGTLNGNGGFYSCVNGSGVSLFLQSNVTSAEVRQVNSAASSRLFSIQPSPASASSCALEGSLHSGTNTSPTSIDFVNQTANTLKVYGLDSSGVRQYSFDLAPTQSVTQSTFNTNPWVVTDSSGNCLDIFVATQTASLATIQ